MPALTDPKAETFARSVAAGCTKRDAALAAGYSKNDAASRGCKLVHNPLIAARISELLEATGKQISVRQAKRVQAKEARVEAAIAKAVDNAIASRDQRVAWLGDRARLMRQVIEERAADPQYAKAAGGKTGLLIKTFRQVGSGVTAKVVPEYAVDTALLKELRATEQQAAQELGQWTEKRELSGEDGGPLKIVITPLEARL